MSIPVSGAVSWCICADRAIFLDLQRDRYFALEPRQNAAFVAWAQPGRDNVASDSFAPWTDRGLLLDGSRPEISRPPPLPPAARDLAWSEGHSARSRDIIRALRARREARTSLRRQSIAAIARRIAEAAEARATIPTNAEVRASRIAAAFASSTLSFGSRDRCLAHALAAWRLCHRDGVPAAIVFGVRVDPFAAHCWTQWNDAIVVGGLEEARQFTPILVLP